MWTHKAERGIIGMNITNTFTPSQRSRIGTDSYYSDISRGTIFSGVTINNTGDGFAARLSKISGRAAGMLTVLDDDIEVNKALVKFLSQQEFRRLYDLIDNLSAAAAFTSGPLRTNANAVKQHLDSLKLAATVTMYRVEQAAKEITGHPFASAGFHETDRMAAVKMRLTSPSPASGFYQNFGFGFERNTTEFLDTLFDTFDKDTLSAALDYIQTRGGGIGQNGEELASDRYMYQVAVAVFGAEFARSASANAFDDYAGLVRQQVNIVLSTIRVDVLRESTNYYMEYETRQRVIRSSEELAKISNGQAITESDLSKLRRLEGFDNKVISIRRTGAQYPVDAMLEWKGGKNVLTLSVNVFFPTKLSNFPTAKEVLADIANQRAAYRRWHQDYLQWLAREMIEIPRQILEDPARLMKTATDWLANGQHPFSTSPPTPPQVSLPAMYLALSIASALDVMPDDIDILKIIPANEWKDRKQAVLDGFNSWAGTYTVFGGQTLKVEMVVSETFATHDALRVLLIEPSTILNKLNTSLDTSMSWGGKGIYDWVPDAQKIILMRKDDNPTLSLQDNLNDFLETAKHEFGHTLGLGDAYKGFFFGKGVDVNKYKDAEYSVMLASVNSITSNDIEMVILAFSTGQRQNFQVDLPWQKISEALGNGD